MPEEYHSTFMKAITTSGSDRISLDKLYADPDLFRMVTNELSDVVPHRIDVLVGLVPQTVTFATAVARQLGLPLAIFTEDSVVLGAEIEGKRICILEDEVKTGEGVAEIANLLSDQDATVACIVAIADRGNGAPALGDMVQENGTLYKFLINADQDEVQRFNS